MSIAAYIRVSGASAAEVADAVAQLPGAEAVYTAPDWRVDGPGWLFAASDAGPSIALPGEPDVWASLRHSDFGRLADVADEVYARLCDGTDWSVSIDADFDLVVPREPRAPSLP